MNSVDDRLKYNIERLISYSLEKELFYDEDTIVIRNILLSHFALTKPYDKTICNEELATASVILDDLLDLSFKKGLITDNSTTARDLETAKIMGYLTPRQSEVINKFNSLYNDSPIRATDYFYSLSKNTNYIQVSRTDKNICFMADTSFGPLEITINLSKPEKDPKEIAAAKLAPQSSYPKCLLCVENAGYEGRLNHPARQNHRLIPVTLLNEAWYLQYSPYLYYNEHSIVLNKNHTPMKISRRTFEMLAEFLEKFPHYFIGSNADLPIVGGSILSHDHFQAGRHSFPVESAPIVKSFTHRSFKNTKITIIKWPLSTIRLTSENKAELINAAVLLMDRWKEYEDKEIHAYSTLNGVKTPHNTVTPIARRKRSMFEFDVVLRNNRTTDEYPLGIFHPHDDVHHIKKENIGLIEVMGLAILPARLKDECMEISHILTGNVKTDNIPLTLNKHKEWIDLLTKKYGTNNDIQFVNKIINNEIGIKFARVLEDAGVYKIGDYERFYCFMKAAGFNEA